MKSNIPGSALIVVMLITSVLLICMINIIRSSTYMHDIALKRQRYEQQYRLTEVLLDYGVIWCKRYGEVASFDSQGTVSLVFDSWLSDVMPGYNAKLIIKKIKDDYALDAHLIKNNNVLLILSCTLKAPKEKTIQSKSQTQKIVLQNWKISSS